MLLLKTDRLSDCDPWSTRSNDFSIRYPRGMKGLTQLPHETVIDRKMLRSMRRANRRSMCRGPTAP